MLRNYAKYRAFDAVLKSVANGKVVLDIGAGSGVLSLIALARGAKHVIAVEREPVCELLDAVLSSIPGIDRGRLEVIRGDIFEIQDQRIGPGTVVVSETLGYLGFEEDIACIMAFARSVSGAEVLLPKSLKIMAIPLSVGASDQTAPYLSTERMRPALFSLLSEPEQFPLGQGGLLAGEWVWQCEVAPGETIDGIGFAVEAKLIDGIAIGNRNSDVWPRCVCPLPLPVKSRAPMALEIRLALERESQSFHGVLSTAFNGEERDPLRFEAARIRGGEWLQGSPSEVVTAVKRVLGSLGAV